MNNVEITENLVRSTIEGHTKIAVMWNGGKQASVLWHIVSANADATPVFIEHGRHPQGTHDLLHEMFKKGNFPVAFYTDGEVIKHVRDWKLHVDELPANRRESWNKIQPGDVVPYTLDNFAVRHFVFDEQFAQIRRDFDLVFMGSRQDRRKEDYYLPYIEHDGGRHVVRPLLHWDERNVWDFIRNNNVPYNKRYGDGYRIVDDISDHMPDSRPAWEQEFLPGSEFNVDMGKIAVVKKLKDMGYLGQALGVAGVIDTDKAKATYNIIYDAIERFGHIATAWSVGKDSTVVSWMAQSIRPDIPILFLDSRAHFKSTYEYVDLMKLLFQWDVVTLRRPEPYPNIAVDKTDCCFENKIKPLHDAIRSMGLRAVLTGIKHTDGYTRQNAPVEEVRTTYDGVQYVQINPLLDWGEHDVRAFLDVNGIPLNPVYLSGYRSLDCEPCTLPNEDMAMPERHGRTEKDSVALTQLRKIGYF